MSKYTFVYIRDSKTNGCCSACVEHLKENDITNLKLAFSFGSPTEKNFDRKEARKHALERMEAGKFVIIEKRKGVNTYGTVSAYLKQALKNIEEDYSLTKDLLGIEPYKIGKNVCLVSEFWGWLFNFARRDI